MARETVDRGQIQDSVRDYLVNAFLKSRKHQRLRDDDELLLVLNSLQLLRMVIELESRFQISISNNELTPENLGSVERIAVFLEQKLLESRPSGGCSPLGRTRQ